MVLKGEKSECLASEFSLAEELVLLKGMLECIFWHQYQVTVGGKGEGIEQRKKDLIQ